MRCLSVILPAAAVLVFAAGWAASAPQTPDAATECPASPDPVQAPQPGARPGGYVECIEAEERSAEVETLSARWAACFDASDPACLASLYAADALLLPDGAATLRGRAAIAAYFQGRFAPGQSRVSALAYDSLDIAGDAPVVVQRWRIAESGPEGTVRTSGRSLLILRRGEDGALRIWRQMDNAAPDAPPETWPESLF